MAFNPVPGTPGPDLLPGTPGDDSITGGGGNDTITAQEGDDLVYGDTGNDDVLGYTGADTLYGGNGDDTLDGHDGDDRIYGGNGNDWIYDGYGGDRAFGGEGDDVFFGGEGDNWFYGGTGRDVFITGDALNTGIIRAFGGDDDDAMYFFGGTDGTADGGTGVDFIAVHWWDSYNGVGDVTVRLTGPDAGARSATQTLLFSNFEILRAQTHSGNDSVYGGAYDDDIGVHLGANTVEAHGGNDRVNYATGALNMLDGGDGTDTLGVSHAPSQGLIFTVTGSTATDNYGSVIRNFEHYHVQGYFDRDEFRMGAGNDTLYGFGGSDILWGGAGTDQLRGGDGGDILYGDDGNDFLFGDKDFDALFGGTGNDILNGGAGGDALEGGAGADEFRFAVLETGIDAELRADVVRDMEVGVDRILIRSDMIGNALPLGALDPARFALGAAAGTALQFVLVDGFPDESRFYLDTNGSDAGGATLLARFEGAPAFSAADIFIF
jgi:Ca2+-binding RTX toxin-like protein